MSGLLVKCSKGSGSLAARGYVSERYRENNHGNGKASGSPDPSN